jgi:hypothetical protein
MTQMQSKDDVPGDEPRRERRRRPRPRAALEAALDEALDRLDHQVENTKNYLATLDGQAPISNSRRSRKDAADKAKERE